MRSALLIELSEAWRGISANRTRSVLTILGIVIGVAAVIGVVSIVQGLSHSVTNSFKYLGANSLTIRSDTSFEEQLQGKVNRLTLMDFERLTKELGDTGTLTPSFSPFGVFGTAVKTGNRSAFTRVSAVTESYPEAFNSYVSEGRFFTRSDNVSRRKVCVIGTTLRDHLSLPTNPIGQFVNVGGEWLKVIGVAEERGEMFGLNQDDYMLIPFSTGEALAGSNAQQDITIMLNVRDADTVDQVQLRAERVLRQSRKLKPGEKNDFKVQTSQQLTESFSQLSNAVTAVASGMVGISLLVAGVGIMNMMLVSVAERTREIGICKALGAQRGQILRQFLFEAVLMSFFGGVIGVAGGYALGAIGSIMMPNFPSAVVPWWAVAFSIGFSTFIGVLFGVVPAAKAANLSPMEALRRE